MDELMTGRTRTNRTRLLSGCMSLAIAAGPAGAQSMSVATGADAQRLQQLEAEVGAQKKQIADLRKLLSEQQQHIDWLRQALQPPQLGALSARGAPPGAGALPAGLAAPQEATQSSPAAASAPSTSDPPGVEPQERVGRAPDASRPPEVAQIFDQPGVLTPRGKFVMEPSLQIGYSASDRVALVGYTIIPAILIGLIDVRQVKTTSLSAALTGRYGLSDRLELELKVPYSYVNGDTISREIFTGTAQDSVFNTTGRGIGDVEVTGRYQLNSGGIDRPYYVLWLRYKSRTGRDLFEVTTDCITRCVANATGTGLPLELPTGSGFEAVQPGITWLYASDPVVLFGSFSYLHNFTRDDVSRTVLTGAPEGFPQTTTELLGEVKAGDIIGFNIGMGLALNEKFAISMGYDQSLVGKTKQNGEDTPGAVRVMLGTLVLGGSYRLSDRTTLNVALGVGVTRDTPDVSLSVRVPVTF